MEGQVARGCGGGEHSSPSAGGGYAYRGTSAVRDLREGECFGVASVHLFLGNSLSVPLEIALGALRPLVQELATL